MFKSIVLGAFAAAFCVSAASAEPIIQLQAGDRAIPVRYADLDLAQTEDARAMVSRLRYAAYVACDSEQVEREGPALRRDERACRSDAVEDALTRLDHPQVTLAHQSRR